MQLHIHRDGQQFGPYTIEETKKYLQEGTIVPTDLAWFEGASGWMPIAQIQELRSSTPPPLPAQAFPTSHPTSTLNDPTEAVTSFIASYNGAKSKNIWALNEIPAKVLEYHRKSYLNLAPNEQPLILLNDNFFASIGGYGWSGLVITNKAIHFSAIKKSYFGSIMPGKVKGAFNFSEIRSLEIAEHDTCFGSAYIGHELRINDKIIGYVRMGTGTLFDEMAITYLNALFNQMAKYGILVRPAGIYAFK